MEKSVDEVSERVDKKVSRWVHEKFEKVELLEK